ncbi:MAG TPA: GAF domain-containing sensor histidine kinase [Nocardioidaceae bacterium]|nr:GAF domain-containing sensor histidine kinase [Nocardioidaceae bacterium]
MSQEPEGPSSALSPLGRARLDELLQELLGRVNDVVDTQERLRGLLDAVVAIAGDLTLERVLEQIVGAASRLVDARYVALGVLGSGSDRRLQSFITVGLTDDERARIGALPRGKGLLGHLIDHPEPLRLHDLHEHADSYGFPPNHPPMTSFLGVPIRIRDKVFGNLYLTEKAGGADFSQDDEEIVVALAAAAGVVIENARLYAETARREAWLAAAAEITAALLGPVRRSDALQLIADRARSVPAADLACVLLREADDRLVIQVVSGGSSSVVGESVAIDGTLAGSVVTSGDMLIVEDASLAADDREVDFTYPLDWPTPGPIAMFPLRSAAGVDGVLSVVWDKERADDFAAIHPELPAAFAEQAALALQVTKAREDQALLAVFEDRDRIARDLHDLVIQRLFAIGLGLQNTVRLTERPEAADRLSDAIDEIDATIKDVRRSIFSLASPTDAASLRKELDQVLGAAEDALGFRPALRTSGPVDSAIPAAAQAHIVAVTTEAVSNAARHARPEELIVSLSVADGRLVLEIADDGSGFEPESRDRDSGIANMRYRAETLGGSCVVTSAPGQGTTVVWSVPVG